MHLESGEIAAYLDRTLTPVERERIEAHLVDCLACRRETIEVSRVRTDMGRRRTGWLIGVPLAAAAIVVLVLIRSGENPAAGTGPVLRDGGHETMSQVVLVSPTETGATPAGQLTFIWRSAGALISYRLVVTDRAGDVVWNVNTADTTARLPATVQLHGAEYYWYVDGLLPEGRSITSGVHPFTVRR